MRVIVFATAYDEYALRAFDAHAVDYLLKPYSDERFEVALTRAIRIVRGGASGALAAQMQALLSHRTERPGRRDSMTSGKLSLQAADSRRCWAECGNL
jgi:two-component system LytT family response regulator